jgi:hypothetical protein
MTRTQVIEDAANPVFVESLDDGRIGLRIGKPIREGVAVASLLADSLSHRASLSRAEARIVAYALLAAAERLTS